MTFDIVSCFAMHPFPSVDNKNLPQEKQIIHNKIDRE